MRVCAIVGSGPLGEYVAAHVRDVAPDAVVVGLAATRSWLGKNADGYVSTLRFGQLLDLLKKHSITEVVFAGDPYSSITAPPDLLALRYMWSNRGIWLPHAFLRGVNNALADHGITIRSVPELMPWLAAKDGLSLGQCAHYDPSRDLAATLKYIRQQPWRAVRQAAVVNDGTVVLAENSEGTNGLIRAFGHLSDPAGHRWPVLCKVALDPFSPIDAPTIGEETVVLCIQNGIKAIAVEATATVLMQRDAVEGYAREGLICIKALSKSRFLNAVQQDVLDRDPKASGLQS